MQIVYFKAAFRLTTRSNKCGFLKINTTINDPDKNCMKDLLRLFLIIHFSLSRHSFFHLNRYSQSRIFFTS